MKRLQRIDDAEFEANVRENLLETMQLANAQMVAAVDRLATGNATQATESFSEEVDRETVKTDQRIEMPLQHVVVSKAFNSLSQSNGDIRALLSSYSAALKPHSIPRNATMFHGETQECSADPVLRFERTDVPPLNEFTENHTLLKTAFPSIFFPLHTPSAWLPTIAFSSSSLPKPAQNHRSKPAAVHRNPMLSSRSRN